MRCPSTILAAAFLGCVLWQSVPVAAYEASMVDVTGYKLLSRFNGSALYSLEANATYAEPVYLIDLHGSRYDMGYAYGLLLADEIIDMYRIFFGSLLGPHWYDIVVEGVLHEALAWQVGLISGCGMRANVVLWMRYDESGSVPSIYAQWFFVCYGPLQWNDFLSKELPQQYKEELAGIDVSLGPRESTGCGIFVQLVSLLRMCGAHGGHVQPF